MNFISESQMSGIPQNYKKIGDERLPDMRLFNSHTR
jgi:hypothetical protein